MAKHGKKYRAAREKVEQRSYSLAEGVGLLKEVAFAGFDETVEIAMRLGVDPRHADQMVRGTVVLPHGTGKEMRVAVFAQGEKVKDAEEAGADAVGAEDLAEKIEGGWMEFDAIVASPDMMRIVGRLGRVLGPRGLMPNPKAGTVSADVGKAVRDIKSGKVEFRVEKAGIVQAPVGKVSFTAEQLEENARSFIEAVTRARPAVAKGRFVRSIDLSSTMGPGVSLDETALAPVEA